MSNWKEVELEQYIVDHLGQFVHQVVGGNTSLDIQLLGRQVRCPYGIIDLIAQIGLGVWIIELKAVRADERAVGQLQRYLQALELFTNEFDVFTPEEFDEVGHAIQVHYTSILVAPEIKPNAVMGVGMGVEATRFDDGAFSFETVYNRQWSRRDAIDLRRSLRPYFQSLRQDALNRAVSRAQPHQAKHIDVFRYRRN